MALTHLYGDFFHQKATKEREPLAIQIRQLWTSEHDPVYRRRKRAVVAVIGRQRWNMLESCRPVVGSEAFYRSLYDAMLLVQAPATVASLPPL